MKSAMLKAAATAAVLIGSSTGEPAILFRGDPSEPGFGSVILSGLSVDTIRLLQAAGTPWRRLFPVYVGDVPADREDRPPVLGHYTIEASQVRFTPRLPFVPGLAYSARFLGEPSRRIPAIESTFTMPEAEGLAPTRVEAVYPSGDEMPANLLRFYVHFSAPMLPKDVHLSIRLHDEESGTEVPLAFVEVPSGLWDPEDRRLTLFVHPGRVKRGVSPGEAMGPVLVEGRSYRLTIDAGMPDASGRPLGRAFNKRFRVVRADRTSPDPALWTVTPPASPRGPVILDIPTPLDHALLRRLVSVRGESGRIVAGRVRVSREETRWELEPLEDWEIGRYRILVDPAIEDLAGNTPRGLFEEPMGHRPVESASLIDIAFEVGPKNHLP